MGLAVASGRTNNSRQDMGARKRIGGGSRATVIVQRHFGAVDRFDTREANFSPLPWLYRRLQWYFTPRAWQVLTYIIMRAGPEGLFWMNDRQIAVDLGIGHRKVTPQIQWLVEQGFVAEAEVEGLRYLCLVHPGTVIAALHEKRALSPLRVQQLSDELVLCGSPPLEATGDVPPKVPTQE